MRNRVTHSQSESIRLCFPAAADSISTRADESRSPGSDAAENKSDKKRPWKPEDVIFAATASPQTRISPDAKWLVWVKSTGDKDKDTRVSNLTLSSLTENKEIPLTRGSDSNGQPQWSPDGQLIVFASNRLRPGAKPQTAAVQIWLINAHGGEPWVLTELARAPRRVDWIDRDTIIFSAQEDGACRVPSGAGRGETGATSRETLNIEETFLTAPRSVRNDATNRERTSRLALVTWVRST